MARAKPTPDLTAEDIDKDLSELRSTAEQDAYIANMTQNQADMYQAYSMQARPPEGPQVLTKVGHSTLARPQVIGANSHQMIADALPKDQAEMMYSAPDLNRWKSLNGQLPEDREQTGLLDNKFGLGLRAATQGAMALPGIGFDFASQTPGFTREAVDKGFDKLGAMRPETANQRVLGDIISGMSGVAATGGLSLAGAVPGATENLLTRATVKLGTHPMGQLVSGGLGGGAGGIVREEGGSPSQQLAATLIGGLSPQITASLMKPVITGKLKPGQLAPILDAFETAGATPSVGQLTGGNKAQGLESFLNRFYGSTGHMQDFARDQQHAIGTTMVDKADALAGGASTSPQTLGNMILEQYGKFAKPANASMREDLQNKISSAIPGDPLVPVTKLSDTAADVASLNPSIPNLSVNTALNPNLPKMTSIQRSLQKDLAVHAKAQIAAGVPVGSVQQALPLSAVRWAKTRIGSLLDDSVFNKDIPAAELKRLSGGISQDVRDFVKTQGPAAEKAFDDMNAWETAYHKNMEHLSSVLDKKGGAEKVFEAAFGGTKSGPTVVNSVYGVLTPSGKKILTSGFMRRMARTASGNPDEFDIGRLFSNYHALEPEAKQVIFGHLGQGYVDDLDKIDTAMQKILQERKDYGMSGAGQTGLQMPLYAIAGLAGAVTQGTSQAVPLATGALAGTAALALGAKAAASWMTNPKVVRWLASNEIIPASSYGAAINLLAQRASKENDPDMQELAEYLKSQEGQK